MLKFERDIFENYQTQCFVHQLLKACKYFDNESHHGVLLLLPPTMYPNAHTKSTCALGSSGNGGGTLHFYCCSVSANIQVFYYCGNDIEHEVKLGPPRMGIVEYVDFVISSLLKIKVTLFIFTSIPRWPLHTSLFISSLLTLDNLITICVC